MQLKPCVLLAFFLSIASSSTIEAPGSLNLHSTTPTLLAGSFSKDGTTLIFTARPSALNLLTNGKPLVSFIDYGAFLRVHLASAVFLVATGISERGKVIEITTTFKSVSASLPNTNMATAREPDENLQVFEELQSLYSDDELKQAETHLTHALKEFLQRPETKQIPFLSIKLASAGITSISHPSALVIHMPALRIAKRLDLDIDSALVKSLNNNAQHQDELDPQCAIEDICNNPCFGMCGVGCNCWSWICGDCNCHKGCWQHDCCCACEGESTPCCLNLFTFHCNGYDNNCTPPE